MTTSINQQCTQCQAMLTSSAKFCHLCGTRVTATLSSKEEPLQFMRVREQSHGAYSILVPKGWQYAASIQLYPDGNAVSVWQVCDPSGTVTLSCPGTIFSFQEPMMSLFGQMLPNRRPMQCIPAQIFVQRFLLPQLHITYPQMQTERIVAHPELIDYIRQLYSTTGQNPAQAQFDIASIQFTFMKQDQNYRQINFVTTLCLPTIHIWDASITNQLCAPADKFATYVGLLTTIGKSFQWNQQWIQARNVRNEMLAAQMMQQSQARTQQAQMQALQVQRQSIMDIGNIARASQTHQMAVQEQQFNSMDNIIAGNVDLRGPDGHIYNVTNDYQQRHWIDGLGQVYGGSWNARPGLNWTPLEPTGD